MSYKSESTGGGLILEPSNELKFKGPFDDYVSVTLRIRNTAAKRVAFKVKTTAPKRYCVKPNSGILDPEQSMSVSVILQPFNCDPIEMINHKFMLQYVYLNENEVQLCINDILNKWKDMQASRFHEIILKCVFESNIPLFGPLLGRICAFGRLTPAKRHQKEKRRIRRRKRFGNVVSAKQHANIAASYTTQK
jgi:hypothetical protein